MLKKPENYKPKLDIRTTEIAIKQIKDYFENALAEKLNLIRVSAPLFVYSNTGFNDDLNGIDRPVSFDIKNIGYKEAQIVHSLAKWKRMALKRYGFTAGEGVYTDMNAIRRDDDVDNIHSIYVDQWDWEKIISKEERNVDTLRKVVKDIYHVIKSLEDYVCGLYPDMPKFLPDEIKFITTQELEELYPQLTPKQREDEICRIHKAVFISQIGKLLKSGAPHDSRAPDYDDWELNGDILLWNPTLEIAFELSSMGIRVDEDSLVSQLMQQNQMERLKMEYHENVLNKNYPYTLGGGIGQSRLCMYFLGKAHIGEVHASLWPDDMVKECSESGIILL